LVLGLATNLARLNHDFLALEVVILWRVVFMQNTNESLSSSINKKVPVTSESSAIDDDTELAPRLDKYSIEDVVEFKISRFFDQLGSFYPDNVHELIMTKVEKPLLAQILRRTGGNQVHAARILGINRNTLRKKMKIYGL